jgi:uroporphyrin-III C-methyltransferase
MTHAIKGRVYLVGAGPGDPELLTLRALRLLETADVIFHDDLVPDEVLELVHRHALITSVGKRCGRPRITQAEIHTLLIDSARAGQSVVRLKSGDPLVFGRAGEEIAALRAANVPFEVVPGVTAAFAAGAALALPLTDRKSASKLILCTGQLPSGAARYRMMRRWWSTCQVATRAASRPSLRSRALLPMFLAAPSLTQLPLAKAMLRPA